VSPAGIVPAPQRDGLTEQPRPRPAQPEPDAGPRPDRPLVAPLMPGYLWLGLAHLVASPLVLLLGGPAAGELAAAAYWALFFPAAVLEAAGVSAWLPAPHMLLVNSLLWTATAYGLLLAERLPWRGPRGDASSTASSPRS
jgi:hypothetical protein